MERYGTIPKLFTKEWWAYYWEYYKWHTIIGFFLAGAAAITVIQVMSKADYDLVVSYIGELTYSEKSAAAAADAMTEIVPDVNENNNVDVSFQVMPLMPGIETNAQYTMAMESKKTFEVQVGETVLFITDSTQTAALYEYGIADGIFVSAEEWLSYDNADKTRAEGNAFEYFVKLDNLSFFESCGVNLKDAYIGIRNIRQEENEEEYKKTREAADMLANYLLEN